MVDFQFFDSSESEKFSEIWNQISELRYRVYSDELKQYENNQQQVLVDPGKYFITCLDNQKLIGYVSLNPHSTSGFRISKYFSDEIMNENIFSNLIESTLIDLHSEVPKQLHTIIPIASFAGNNCLNANTLNSISSLHKLTSIPSHKISDLNLWKGIAELILTKNGAVRKTINKAIGFPANEKKIKLDFNLDLAVLVLIDEQMLHTILRNLISNSIKFTFPGGFVKLETQNNEHEVLFIVSDNGIGIDVSNLGKLFSIDCDLSLKGTENESGTGLGLILCKDFVEKQQGRIWVESELGFGTSFKFTIPKG